LRIFFEESGRLRALWRLILQYLAYRVATVLLVNLLLVAYLLTAQEVASLGGLDTSALSRSPVIVLIGGVASLLAILLSVWLAGRYLDRRPLADFGFHLRGGWWLDLSFGLALGALLITAIFLVELGLGWVSVNGAFEVLIGPSVPFALALLIPLAFFLCVGVYEELLFRGYELRNAAEGLNVPAIGPYGAVLLAWAGSSIFFGVLHAGNPNATTLSTLNIVLAGFMLGLGYVLTGELAISIGLHVTWNLFQSSVYGFPVSGFQPVGATLLSTQQSGPELWTGGAFGPEAGLIGLAAILLGTLLTALWVRLRHGRIALHTMLAQGPEHVRLEHAAISPSGKLDA
jgi:membrane protease YdiL (CAAX protease family)